jgi:hypothetical protein
MDGKKDMVTCSICSQLKDFEIGSQKHGREDEDTFLPDSFAKLKFVKDLKPGRTRTPELLVCPECGTFYFYKVEYEFLATGSEDEQHLTRLASEDEIKRFIN